MKKEHIEFNKEKCVICLKGFQKGLDIIIQQQVWLKRTGSMIHSFDSDLD